MVAIVTGNGLGLQSSSALGLGSRGQIGNAVFGQNGERLFVNAANGNLIIQDRDQFLAGKGISSELHRAYNSQGQLTDDHWRAGSSRSVDGLTGTLNTVGSTITRTDWDGSAIVYRYDAVRGVYIEDSGNGARDTLRYDATARSWTWTDGATQITETYDGTHNGRITARTDRDGNTVKFLYNAAGQVSEVHNASGDITFLDYSGKLLTGLRTLQRNADGTNSTVTAVRYAYDSQNRLTRVTLDLSPRDNSIADGKVFTTTYTYDGASSRIASVTQSDGASASFTYIQQGGEYRVATVSQQDGSGGVRVTRLSYDLTNRTTTITDPLGYTTVLTYDTQNQLTKTEVQQAGGATQVQRFSYDARGNVTRITDAVGNATDFTYDDAGNLLTQTDAAGNRVVRTYGARNELLSETVYRSATEPATTRYAYDDHGHLRFVVSAEGRVVEYRYNAAGEQVSALAYTDDVYTAQSTAETSLSAWVGALKNKSHATRTDTTYDFRGQVQSTTRYAKLMADGAGDPNGAPGDILRTRYVYDAQGNLLQRIVGTDTKPEAEQFTYDGLGRLLSATKFDGTITLYQYDGTRNQTITTFANGLTRTAIYNAVHELISVTESLGGKLLSQLQNRYDADGRLRTSIDATGLATHYLYDEQGRKTGQVTPDGALTEYRYNANGQLIGSVQYATKVSAADLARLSANATTALTLDSANIRPKASVEDRTEWRFYDEAGRLSTTVGADGAVTAYKYDGMGSLIQTTAYTNTLDVSKLTANTKAAALLPPANAADRVTRYFYDADGQLTGQLDAEGYLTEYRYNAAGQKQEIVRYATVTTSSKRQDASLRDLTPGSNASDIHQYFLYDARGLLTAEVDGEGYVTKYNYDVYGNVAVRERGLQRIDMAQARLPQQVPINFDVLVMKASGGLAGKEVAWPTIEVWVEGVKAGEIALNNQGAARTSSSVTASNIALAGGHTVDFVVKSLAPGLEVTVNNIQFGGKLLGAPRTPIIDYGTGAAAFDGIDAAAVQNVLAGNTLKKDGALRLAVSSADALDIASRVDSGAYGEQTLYVYDAAGKLLSRSQRTGGVIAETTYAYDSQGNLTGEVRQDRAWGQETPRIDGASTNRYDAQGSLIGQLSGEGSAALAKLGAKPTQAAVDAIWDTWGVKYSYDAQGRRTSMTDANGKATYYYYDNAGRLTHTINALGEVVERQYTAFGDLAQTIVYATRLDSTTLRGLQGGLLTDALGTTLTALGADGKASRTTFTYTTTGQLRQVTQADGGTTTYSYNAFGDNTSTTRAISNTASTQTDNTYDKLGRLIQQIVDRNSLSLTSAQRYDAFGRIVETTDANGVIRRNDYDRNGNVVVVTDGTGAQSKLTYDAFGNVLTRTDRTGQTTTYAYNTGVERNITVTTPEGIVTTTTYDSNDQVLTLQDGNGNTTRYVYNQDGQLIRTEAPNGTTTAQYDRAGQRIETVDARGVHTVHSYDAAGRVLTRTVDPTGLKLVTQYAYDAKGQIVRTTDPSGVVTEMTYDLAGNKASVVTDPTGLKLQTTFTYDKLGNVLSVTEGAGSANPKVTQYTYDGAGRLTSTIVDPTKLRLTTRYTYDKLGNVVATTDAANAVTRYVYDAEGRLTHIVDGTGALVQNVYDAEGRLIARQGYANRLTLTGAPTQLSATDVASRLALWPERDQITRYVYDADGRQRYEINALGYVTERTYDANGNVVRSTAYATAINVPGNPKTGDVAKALQTNASDRTTRMVYDAANRPTTSIDALGFVTRNSYDANGNLTDRTQYTTAYTASGNPAEATMQAWLQAPGVASAASNRTTTWIHDAAGRSVYVIDPEGYVTENRYDGAGRAIKSIRYAEQYEQARTLTQTAMKAMLPMTLPTDAVTTDYRYDSAGRLMEMVDALGVVTHYDLDALGRTVTTWSAHQNTAYQSATHREYDAAGRVVSETQAWGTAQAATTQYTYDGTGRVLASTDPNGHTTRYGYDAQGNRTSVTDALAYITRTAYDAFGNAVKVTDARGNATYFYFDQLNHNVLQVNAVGGVIATEYSVSGQPLKITQFSAAWTNKVDENTAWTSITPPRDSARDAVTQLAYDKLDRLTQSTDAEGYREQYRYDAFGNRTGYTSKIGGTFAYTYDRRGLMLSETLPITSSGRPVVNRFEYDARGNRITVTEAAGLPEQRITRIAYDGLDREIRRIGDAVVVTQGATTQTVTPTETKTYDARGNLTHQTDANGNTTAWYYDATNRRVAQVGPDGAYTVWEYDAAGNVTVERRYAELVSATEGATPPAVPNNPVNTRETRYTYDEGNRLTKSSLLNVATGALSSRNGEYIISEGSIDRYWQYDAQGNVVVTIDPNGNRSVTLWDPRGPWKAMEIDAMGYATRWVHDAQGNVLQEIRYASQYLHPKDVGASTNPDQLAQDWPTSPDDRITTYTWDRNGRMISEARQNVAYATVDASNGKLTERVGEARTSYVYDGDGHLLKRTDANNQQREFTYDALGRQTSQLLPEFLNYGNRLTRSSTLFEYDGLNNIVKETRQGRAVNMSIPDQVDTYTYGAGGRLMSKTNSVGLTTQFGYDAVGNTTYMVYTRLGQTVTAFDDKTYVTYDAANREVSRIEQSDYRDGTRRVVRSPVKEQRYNAFGEITGRRTRLEANTNVAWQEYAEYNNAGNVIRTNFNDGVSHVYLYDRNGNATLQVESMQADLRTYTINDILKDLPLNQTFTGYDARNQVTEIRQPRVFAGAPQVTFSAVEIHIDGGKFANTQLSVGGWLGKPQDPVVMGPTASEDAGLAAEGGAQPKASAQVHYYPGVGYDSDTNRAFSGFGRIAGFNVDVPAALRDVYGAYEVEARISFTATGRFASRPTADDPFIYYPYTISGSVTSGLLPNSPVNLVVPIGFDNWDLRGAPFGLFSSGDSFNLYQDQHEVQLSYTVELYLRSSSEGRAPTLISTIGSSGTLFSGAPIDDPTRQFLGTVPGFGGDRWQGFTVGAAEGALADGPALLTVANSTLPTDAQGMLYYRRAGSTDGFQPLPKSASSTELSYRADVSGLGQGDYELVFIAVRADGTLLRRDEYIAHLGQGTVETVPLNQRAAYAEVGFQYNETGTTLWQAPGVLNLYAPHASNNALADSVRVRLRDPKTNAIVMGDIAVGRNAAGAFALDFSTVAAGSYVVEIDLLNAAGQRLDTLVSQNTTLGAGTPTFDFRYLKNKTTSVTFHSQDAAATYLRVSWMQEDENGVLQKKYTTVLRNGAGDFVWDTTADGLLPDPEQMYTYEIDYTAFDATNKPLNMGRGQITIGMVANDVGATLTGSESIPYLEFKPISPQGNVVDADTITLFYRPAPKKDADYDVLFKEITLKRDADGKFFFNAFELPTDAEFEYRYTARDTRGEITLERSGFFLTGTRSYQETNTDIEYIIEQTAKNKDMTVDRNQLRNAFGEVATEVDGRGNVTQLFYNTNGNLVLKQEPEVSVTLSNGFVTKIAPQTRFYYDLTGNLVGLKDANGHLSTQQWNYSVDQPAVAKSWDAQGSAKTFAYDGFGNLRKSTDEIGRLTQYIYDNGNRLTTILRPPVPGAAGQGVREDFGYDTVGNRISSSIGRTGYSGPAGDNFIAYSYDQQGRITRVQSPAGRSTSYTYEWVESILSVGSEQTGGWRKTTQTGGAWGDNNSPPAGTFLTDDYDLYGRVTRHEDLHNWNTVGRVTTYVYNNAGLLAKQVSTAGQHIEYEYYGHGRVRSIKDLGVGTEALYEYDGDGNRTYESFRSISGAYVFSQAYVQYDALNRVTEVKDLQYTVRYEYDAVGNRRHMEAEYHDPVNYHKSTQEYWYEYDSQNRFTVSMGQLSGGKRAESADDTSVGIVIGEGGDGVQLGYNAAGERSWARYASDGHSERYEYDPNGYLVRQFTKAAGSTTEVLIQQRQIDIYGRALQVIQWDPAGSGKQVSNIERTYDTDGLVLTERDNVAGTTTRNTYYNTGVLQRSDTTSDDGKGASFTTTYEYEWWDGPKQKRVTTQGTNPNAPGWKPATSTYNYDVNGNLKAVLDDGGGQAGNGRAFVYWTDQQGQVQRRDEVLGAKLDANGNIIGGTANRQHSYYYLNGQRIGNVGNDGIEKIDYVQELAGKLGKAGDNDYKVFTPQANVDFDENFMAINGTYPGLSPTVWTARDGDTLQSIAAAVWGDETLWYILADANGLKSSDGLKAGQMLRVPNKVTNVHNTARTFKPYDPGRAIGNTQPTLPDPPPPPGKGGCGGAAAIIAVVVAIVATVVTAGAAGLALGAVASGTGLFAAGTAVLTGGLAGASLAAGAGLAALGAAAIGGAVGAAASQGVMIAAGEQSGFNWKGVALGAASAAVGAGVGIAVRGTSIGASIAGALNGIDKSGAALAAASGGVRSVATQGIGIVTGVQNGFDWKGVAASAIAGGVGHGVGQTTAGLGQYPSMAISRVAADAASTLVRGGSLQRNLGNIAMDAVASTVGNLVVDQVQASSMARAAEQQRRDDLYSLAGGARKLETGLVPSELEVAGWNTGVDMGIRNEAARVQPEGVSWANGDVLMGRQLSDAYGPRLLVPTSYSDAGGDDGLLIQGLKNGYGRLSMLADMAGEAFARATTGHSRAELADAADRLLHTRMQVGGGRLPTDEDLLTGASSRSADWTSQSKFELFLEGTANGLNAVMGLGGGMRPPPGAASGMVLTRSAEMALANSSRGVGASKTLPDNVISSSNNSGDPLSPDFVGPLDLNTQATRDVGKVTAPIDFDGHILGGEVNSRGKVVGGHSTALGNVRVIPGTETAPNTQGVYEAQVEVRNPANPNQWLQKSNGGGVSSMFPDSWTADRIKVEVDAAYRNRVTSGNTWTGVTPSGVKVEGYTTPKTTVYPKY